MTIIMIITVGKYLRGIIDENQEIMAPMFFLAQTVQQTWKALTYINTPSPA